MQSKFNWLVVPLTVVALTACGGGSDEKSQPTNAPTIALTPPPTSKPAPTTVPAPDYTYEIVLVGPVVYNQKGEYHEPILDNGTYPLDAQNPEHPDGVTLREILEFPDRTLVCFHTDGFGSQNTTIHGGATYFYSASGAVAPTAYLAVYVTDQYGADWYWDAAEMGIINYPDGTWAQVTYVTPGAC